MDYTYTWADYNQTVLLRSDGVSVPTDPLNTSYAEFLASGATAAPYVAPPEPEPLTTEEKIVRAGFILGELEEYLVGKIQQRLND